MALKLAAAAALLGCWAAPALADEAAPARIELTDDGPIFVTPAGMSLYVSTTDDATPGKSVCSATVEPEYPDPAGGFGKMKIVGYRFARPCATVSPPFLAPAEARPSGDWTLFDRVEGGRQWVYRGRPLYTSIRDHRPGDRNGIGMDQLSLFRGFRLAAAPWDLPPGVKLLRKGDELVLTFGGRIVFTPRGALLQKAALGTADALQPMSAPEILRIGKPWSVIEAGLGQRQYAYGGKPLFTSATLSEDEVLASGNWEMVVIRRGPGHPSAIGTYYSPVIGDYYTTRSGQTLYIFTCTAPSDTGSPGCDLPGGPAAHWSAMCGTGEECARRWRPYLAAPGARPQGEWSIVEVSDPMFVDPAGQTYPAGARRLKAWAYRGRPVLTYYEDKAPGDIWGNMTRWFANTMFMSLPVPGQDVP
ncbi:MAG: hypothetical protein QM676_02005 [Novosphingobium sp.]